MSGLVSIILPVFNSRSTVRRAMKSVLDQTYKKFELIVVNDGSTDGCEKEIQSITDPRVRYITLPVHKGDPAAKNEGIRNASGEFIAFLDSGGEWLPEKLEKQIKILSRAPDEAGGIYSRLIRVEGNKRENIPSSASIRPENAGNVLLRNSFITAQAVLLRKKCFDTAGSFDDSLPRLQDWELWLRISQEYRFLYIAEPLAVVYVKEKDPGDLLSEFKAAFEIIEKKYSSMFKKKNGHFLANQYYRMSRLSFKHKNTKEGIEFIKKTISLYPWDAEFLALYWYVQIRLCCHYLSKHFLRKNHVH